MHTIAVIDYMSSRFPKKQGFLRGYIWDTPPFVKAEGRKQRIFPTKHIIELHLLEKNPGHDDF